MSERSPGAVQEPEIVIIAAVAERSRLIGKGLDLPWRLPEDLRRFKRLTTGKPLVMGRRTFEAVLHQFGGPLPGRRILVLTSRGPFPGHPEIETFPSLSAALLAARDAHAVFIGGGSSVYREALDVAHRLELTLVEGDFEGDTWFPKYEHLIGDVFVAAAEELRDGYRFVTYVRSFPQAGTPSPESTRS